VGPWHPGMSPRKKNRQKPPPEHEPSLPLPICKGCGTGLTPEPDRPRRRGAYCPSCLAIRRKELGASMPVHSSVARADSEKLLGVPPTHTSTATSSRRKANAHQRAAQATWEAEHAGEVHDTAWFEREVLTGMQGISLTEIAKATGMSTSSASKVRAGRRVPHPRHWEALAQLAPANPLTSLSP